MTILRTPDRTDSVEEAGGELVRDDCSTLYKAEVDSASDSGSEVDTEDEYVDRGRFLVDELAVEAVSL